MVKTSRSTLHLQYTTYNYSMPRRAAMTHHHHHHHHGEDGSRPSVASISEKYIWNITLNYIQLY